MIIGFRQLELSVASEASFEVRHFVVDEALHELFDIRLEVVSPHADIDLDAVLGQPASFAVQRTPELRRRQWTGLVVQCDHIGIDPENDLSTYALTVRPRLWLLSQQRRYRVFQGQSDPEVVLAVLKAWDIEPRCDFALGDYLGRKYRVQYAESDLSFVTRLLEDSGLTYFFEDAEGDTRLVLTDKPQAATPRTPALPWVSAPVEGDIKELVTKVEVHRHLRPGRYTQRDVDYRHAPETPLMVSDAVEGLEAQLERFHHNYGAFLYATTPPGDTPVADDRGAARIDMEMAARQVERRLAAQRGESQRVHFSTSAHDIAPGGVVRFLDHPRPDLGGDMLILSAHFEGAAVGDWLHRVESTLADRPWHPPLQTPKPRTFGLESATVVGSAGDDIHTDEFARVRIQFHWDREGRRDETSSCWVPVNQPWGGAGFGALNIPRVGQEVLIDFLGEDPDRPVVAGRVFTKNNPVPYALPDHKTVSGIRSQTSNQPLSGLMQQVAEQVIAAGKDAAQEAIMAALGEASEQTFGERMPPLAQLIPEVAGMLAKLPQPGGVSFPSANDGEAPAPPPTDGGPSRAHQPFVPKFPDGIRALVQAVTAPGPSASLSRVQAFAPFDQLDPVDALLGAPPFPLAVASVPPRMPTPEPPDFPSVGDGDTVPPTVMSEAPVQPPMPPAAPALPEVPLPEVPMDLARLQAALDNGFGAYSPNGATHLLSGSEVTLDDTFMNERLFVQAQRDFNAVARNNANTIVGGLRNTKVGTSDVLEVGGRQVERIGDRRGVDVRANQVHVIRGNREQTSVEGNQGFVSALEHTTMCKTLAFVAEERLSVDCGPPPPPLPQVWNISGLLMMPDFVILDGPKLFLNPGQDALDQALETGQAPASADDDRAAAADAAAAEAAAAETARDAAVQEARGVYEEAWRNGDLTQATQRHELPDHYLERIEGHPPDVQDAAWSGFVADHGPSDPYLALISPFDTPPD